MAVPSRLKSTNRYVVISSEKENEALNTYLATTLANARTVITDRQTAATTSSILSNIRMYYPFLHALLIDLESCARLFSVFVHKFLTDRLYRFLEYF